MDYAFDKDFLTIVLIAAAVGAFGGLVWDIANPIRRLSKEPRIGLDNKLTFPRKYTSGQTKGWDLGFLGPLIIGAGAGVLVVLLAGRSGPDGNDVVRQLANLAAATSDPSASAAAASKAEDALATEVDKSTLYILAFLGGIAGWALLQSLASRLSSMFEVVVQQSAQATGEAAATAVQQEATKQGVDAETTRSIVGAARDAANKTTTAMTGTAVAD